MNLFGTVLTQTAPSANYRGESAENRAVIQKIEIGRFKYAFVSPEALRNAIRETLAELGLPCNRTRLNQEDQPAVAFQDYPDAETFADDFFMGWLVAASSADRKKIEKELKDKGRDLKRFQYKRDSVLRMNMAVALEPYRHDTVFTQSPQDKSADEAKSHRNADNAQLLHRETAYTAYQYPFALNLEECRPQADWTRALLAAIGQLNNVAGNHARSYFEFAPLSLVIRLTNSLVAGYETYAFQPDKHHPGRYVMPALIDGLLQGDWAGEEFYLGGQIVKEMDGEQHSALAQKGVTLERSPQRLLEKVGELAFSEE
ncbi:type I-B CRISPR-associated protein Cas7/Cst2/DevR [bacterium]|nr:type I-B CRISPR-associated protein Cas7/Cst2/DevR [bacterium]